MDNRNVTEKAHINPKFIIAGVEAPPQSIWPQFPATKAVWTHVTEMIDVVTTATTRQMSPTLIKMSVTSSTTSCAKL